MTAPAYVVRTYEENGRRTVAMVSVCPLRWHLSREFAETDPAADSYFATLEEFAARLNPPMTIRPGIYSLAVYRAGTTTPERGGRFRVLPDGVVQFDAEGWWVGGPSPEDADCAPAWDTVRMYLAHGRPADFFANLLAGDACAIDRDDDGRFQRFNPAAGDTATATFAGETDALGGEECECEW